MGLGKDFEEKMQKLLARYEEFVKINTESISQKLMDIPAITAHYQQIYYALKKKADKLEMDIDRKWTERFLYYKNEFDYTLNTSEIKSFISKDSELLDLKEDLKTVEIWLNRFEEVIKNIDNTRWALKSLIDWEKFKGGVV